MLSEFKFHFRCMHVTEYKSWNLKFHVGQILHHDDGAGGIEWQAVVHDSILMIWQEPTVLGVWGCEESVVSFSPQFKILYIY